MMILHKLRKCIAVFLSFFIFHSSFFIFSSCSKDEHLGYLEFEDDADSTVYFKNNPLPIGKDTIRVLAIGNSYTLDALSYTWVIANTAGLDDAVYCIYAVTAEGASLQQWASMYAADKPVSMIKMAGSLLMPQKTGTLRQLLAQNWDVVTIQQNSTNQIYYHTFRPYIRQLIDGIRQSCPNPNVAIAYQMSWSYGNGYKFTGPTGEERWKIICDVAQMQIKRDGIDIIIPCGTAIQNARNTSLETARDLTRDGTHLCYGVGRYVAGVCWLQSIIAPIYHLNLKGVRALHHTYLYEDELFADYAEREDVTSENYLLCQLCAIDACASPFQLTIPRL